VSLEYKRKDLSHARQELEPRVGELGLGAQAASPSAPTPLAALKVCPAAKLEATRDAVLRRIAELRMAVLRDGQFLPPRCCCALRHRFRVC
jgi:hypothetical protein